MPEFTPGDVVAEPSQRKKRRQTQLPEEAGLSARVMAVESASASTLPTDFTYGVAVAATDDREAARAAAAIARQVDLPTAALQLRASSGPYAGDPIFVDPLTGAAITLQRARQILRGQLAAQLAATLGREPRKIGRGNVPQGGGQAPRRTKTVDWDPAKVKEYFEVINDAVPGRIPAQTGIAYAMMAARKQVPLGALTRNLGIIKQWNGGSKQLTEEEMVDLSMNWSSTMTRTITTRDIAWATNPEVAAAYSAQEVKGLSIEEASDWEGYQARTRNKAFASGKDFAEASEIANRAVLSAASSTGGFYERIVGPVFAPIGDAIRWIDEREPVTEAVAGAASTVLEPAKEHFLEPVWNGVVEVTDAFLNGAYGVAYGAATIATGGYFQGGVEQGLRDSWAFITREKRFGNEFALATGAEPGTTDFMVRSAAFEFLFGWYVDPLVVLGWASKARALQRLSAAGTTPFTKGTGIFGPLVQVTNPKISQVVPLAEGGHWAHIANFHEPISGIPAVRAINEALDTHVPAVWQLRATEGVEGARFGKSRWTLVDWLMRERNLDRMIDTPRGLYGLGPGMDSRTAAYIRIYVDQVRKGVMDAETKAGVRDIMRVALGVPASHNAGTWFRRAVNENLIGKVQGQIDDVVRRALSSEDLVFGAKGAINYNQKRRLARQIERNLINEVGVSTKRAKQIADDVVKLRQGDLVVPVQHVERARKAAGVRVSRTRLATDVGASELIPETELLDIAGSRANTVTWYDQVYHAVEGTQRVIPTIGPFQFIRDARLGVRSSPLWRNRLAERFLHPFFNRAPQPVLNIEEGQLAEQSWVTWVRAWGVYDADDAARLREQFIRLQTLPSPDREIRWRNFVAETIQESYRRMGLDENMVSELMKVGRPRYDHFYTTMQRAYTAAPSITIGRSQSPILETQLLNALSLPNPLEVRRAVMDTFGSIPGIQRKAQKVFGKPVRELSESQQHELVQLIRFDRDIQITMKKYGGQVAELFTRALKRLFVVRPAWTVRVVFLDENGRATVHLASWTERIPGIRAKGGTRSFNVELSSTRGRVTEKIPNDRHFASGGRFKTTLDTATLRDADMLDDTFGVQYRMRNDIGGTPVRDRQYLDDLREQIRSEGITEPIMVEVQNGRLAIIDGTHRAMLAEELGMRKVPVSFSTNSLEKADETYRWLDENFPSTLLTTTERAPRVESIVLDIAPTIPPEPSVANQLDVTRTYASISEIEGQAARKLGMGPLTPDDARYWDEYERVMNQEVFQDPLGQRILRALVNDTSEGAPYTMEDALAWAKRNPRQYELAQISNMDITDNFNVARAHITYLTGGNEAVARATLQGDFSRMVAREHLAKADLPNVTGDLAAEYLGAKASLGQRAVGRAFDLLGTRPSAFWNRHPLYRNLFARESERLLTQAAEGGRSFTRAELATIKAGLEHGPTAGKTHPLLMRAHEFAVKETQNIMYTMAHRSQFAEARRFLLPFMGPFEEQFTAWATLLWQNPRIAGRVYETTKLALDSGFIQRDDYGELTLSPSVYAPFAVLGDLLGGFEGTDWMPSVGGLNTFWGNTFKVPLPGGGQLPLPMPGFNWAFEELLRAVVPKTWSESEGWRASIYNYAFAYGDRFSMIPNNYQRIFWAAMPIDSDVLQATTEDVLRSAALHGMDVVTTDDLEEGQVNYAWAERHARQFLAYRGLVGTLFPTYPLIAFEHDEARTQYFDWVNETGSFDAADRLWETRYGMAPDSELALISTRVWARGGQALPATEGISKLLADPDFQRVLNQMPELAYFLIPPEVREGKVDLEAYNQQVSAGLRILRPTGLASETLGFGPGTFTINSTIAQHDINQGWEEFFAEDSRFRAQLDAAFPRGVPDDVSDRGYGTYRRLLDNHDRILNEIIADHPLWAGREYGDVQTDDPFYAGNLHMLRTVLETSSEFRENTAFGQAFAEYFEATEGEGGILDRMKRANIRNLDTVAARELGIAGDYKDLLAHLKETYGDDFTRPYDIFLDGRHLVDVTTRGMEHVQSFTPEYERIYDDWLTRWIAAGNRIEHASGDDRFAAEQRGYLKRQELSIEADAIADRFGDPKLNPQYIWFHDQLNKHEQKEVKLQTAIKPYVFLTAFERREILGIETSDDVEQAWADIARDRVQTQRAIAKDPDHEDRYWDEHNRFVEGIVSHVPGMGAESSRNRRWTFTLEHELPKTWRNGPEGDAWDNLFKFSNQVRGIFNRASFVDDAEFQKVKNIMFDYIEELKQYSPHFKDHFELLEGLDYGPGLIDTFLDPYWFLDF